ncbi:hypothetical protein ISN45_Aa02g024440 [Arabidopsis thaliana x Arabidopsis arenosa]|uniref:Uncharacterized protein n=1 Tax=Arabidopsis thaliana x Arabidopsis arenosa TaxID=1240361 RepID=A0A8T2BLE1_9BRAS|nr:hypothetical protein ISN45_Aa02g024440 [Arabidopsis thaliana x Arabidopsis arenosa]
MFLIHLMGLERSNHGSGFLVEIQLVAHYGELDAELSIWNSSPGKAQAEADPLGNIPKKEGEVQQESSNGESLAPSVVSSNPERQGSSRGQEGSGGKDQGEDGEDCHDDDISDADADEDESDLDMAWKMLDIAMAITDKQPTDTMEKFDILCSLAEISLEREGRKMRMPKCV